MLTGVPYYLNKVQRTDNIFYDNTLEHMKVMKNHKQIDHQIQVKAYFSTDPVWLNLLHGDQTTRYSEVHCLFTVRHQPHTRVMRNVFLLVTI